LASLARIFLSGKYVMVVGRDPCRVQPPTEFMRNDRRDFPLALMFSLPSYVEVDF
jgi:hypothetical protein